MSVDIIDATEEVDRKGLGTIQKILSLTSIEGKDRIEIAEVQGYKAIVQKGLHKIGDLVLVVRYDSVLPKIKMFDFMKESKYRVKSKSFNTDKGRIYSQVIVIPIKEIENYLKEENISRDLIKEEADFTDIIGIKKYIVKDNSSKCNFGIMKRADSFPVHIVSKTDEISVQSKISFLDEIKGKACYLTEKIDGCLDENSFLETENGIKTIKDICESKYNGKIKSFDSVKNKVVFNKIINHSILDNNNDWFEIELENNTIIVLTGNHPVYLPDLKCYRQVKNLIGNENLLFNN